MTAYYNEIDPFAAAWLRELIKNGHIAPGDVDERSIEDVRPDDLRGYAQCHFFAGVGVWSLALRRAGWDDDRRVWTGSCPCQPFSAAGKGGGFSDERHLWPAFYWLINQCRPDTVLGEQVASKDGLAWLDLVQADLEGADYASGAVDTCAAGFGAPHIRQRLYWVADANNKGLEGRREPGRERTAERITGLGCLVSGVEYPKSDGREQWGAEPSGRSAVGGCGFGGLGDSGSAASQWITGTLSRTETGEHGTGFTVDGRMPERFEYAGPSMGSRQPGPTNGFWRDPDWLFCRDGKWRPVEPGTFPLAHAGAFRNRVGLLRGAGNAINLAQAQGFIEAVIETLDF